MRKNGGGMGGLKERDLNKSLAPIKGGGGLLKKEGASWRIYDRV